MKIKFYFFVLPLLILSGISKNIFAQQVSFSDCITQCQVVFTQSVNDAESDLFVAGVESGLTTGTYIYFDLASLREAVETGNYDEGASALDDFFYQMGNIYNGAQLAYDQFNSTCDQAAINYEQCIAGCGG